MHQFRRSMEAAKQSQQQERHSLKQLTPKEKRNTLLGCGTLIVIFLLCGIIGVLNAPHNNITTAQTTQATATMQQSVQSVQTHATQVPTKVPTAKPTVAPTQASTPTIVPTDTPTATATDTPTPVPTAAPTATPVPTQVAQPTPTPTVAPAQFAVTFTQTTAGAIGVQTSPGAALTIKVLYNCSAHYATSKSLQGTVYADGNGAYTWYWNDSSSCSGTITATVTATSGSQTVMNATTF